jgi:hypothetical protein
VEGSRVYVAANVTQKCQVFSLIGEVATTGGERTAASPRRSSRESRRRKEGEEGTPVGVRQVEVNSSSTASGKDSPSSRLRFRGRFPYLPEIGAVPGEIDARGATSFARSPPGYGRWRRVGP